MGSWSRQTTYDPITGSHHQFRAYTPDGIAGRDKSFSQDWLERESATRERITSTLVKCDSASEWVLRYSETAASTTIEGIFPSLRRLAEAEVRPAKSGSAEAQALGCLAATEHALRVGRGSAPITLEDIQELHRLAMANDPQYTAHYELGITRAGNVWVGTSGNPNTADFVAPPAEAVPVLLEDLVSYLNESDDPPLAQAALGHAQFERIHPFPDGNGRTGRALIHLLLARRGVLSQRSFPISGALAAQKDDYFAILKERHEPGDISSAEEQRRYRSLFDWFLDMCCIGAGLTERTDSVIRQAKQNWLTRLSKGQQKSSTTTAAKKLLEAMLLHPVCDVETAAELLDASLLQAEQALGHLEGAGIVSSVGLGPGLRGYALTDLFRIQSAGLADKPFMALEEVEAGLKR